MKKITEPPTFAPTGAQGVSIQYTQLKLDFDELTLIYYHREVW